MATQNAALTLSTIKYGVLTVSRNSGNNVNIRSVTIQSDGKIIVAGSSDADFTLARLNSNGSLDLTFGNNGNMTTDFGNTLDYGSGSFIQNDNKIILGGSSSYGDNSDFSIARYNADGSLDNGFDGDGKVIIDTGGRDSSIFLTIQPDRKILIGGTSLVRCNTDGSLDNSFGNNGNLAISNIANAIALQQDGKILLVSSPSSSSHASIILTRYNPDGSLDTSFDGDGEVVTDVASNGNTIGTSVITQADGKILVSGQFTPIGTSITNRSVFALARYNTDGSLDASFDNDGKVTTSINSEGDSATSTALQTDGKILVGGTSGGNFALVRYNTDGSLDSSFGNYGKVTTDIGSMYDVGTSISVQSDGKILMAGQSNSSLALVRYMTDGSLDLSFTGIKQNDLPTGSILITGSSIQGQTLTASGEIADPDGLGDFNFQWLSDGVAITGANQLTYTLSQLDVGKAISFKVSYIDLHGTAESVTSSATALVAPPTNYPPTGNITLLGTASQNQTLFVSNTLVDANGLGIMSYQWLSEDVAITGANQTTYALTQTDVNKNISVSASYTDGLGKLESITSNAVKIANVNDLPTGSVTISGTATQGQVLTASNSLADVDGLGTINYQWFSSTGIINGANQATYTLTATDVGKTISVKASYTDLQGTAESVTSSSTALIAPPTNYPPTGSVTISGTASQNQTLTAQNTLADVNGLGTVSYQWLSEGVAITGANQAAYTLTQADVSKNISVSASYTDGLGKLESVTSNAVKIANVNDVPTGSVTIPGTATQGQVLTVSNSLADLDGLGEISYQWLNSGSPISGANQTTYTLTPTDVGKVISVKASYVDLQNTSESVTSNSLLVEQITNITIDSPTPTPTPTPTPSAVTKATTGNDLLVGTTKADKLSGLAGNDTLIGGLGKDALTGSKGADVFKYTSLKDSGITTTTRDTITDFKHSEKDKIDLSSIDTNEKLAGDQAFKFIGSSTFSKTDATGQLRFDSKTGILYGSTDKDSAAEFSIQLSGVKSVVVDDFIL